MLFLPASSSSDAGSNAGCTASDLLFSGVLTPLVGITVQSHAVASIAAMALKALRTGVSVLAAGLRAGNGGLVVFVNGLAMLRQV